MRKEFERILKGLKSAIDDLKKGDYIVMEKGNTGFKRNIENEKRI